MASEKSKWVILKFLPLLNLRCITRCRRSLLAELGTPLSSISIDNNNNNNSISHIQHNVRRVIRNQTQSPGCDLFVWLSSQQWAHIDQQNTNTLIHAILLDTGNHFFLVFCLFFLIVKAVTIIEVNRHFYQKSYPWVNLQNPLTIWGTYRQTCRDALISSLCLSASSNGHKSLWIYKMKGRPLTPVSSMGLTKSRETRAHIRPQ